MWRRKSFPTRFILSKQPIFYPAKPEPCVGDVLEIGPGNGEFLCAQARVFPSKRFVAVELKPLRFRKLVAMIQRESIKNVLLIHADARILPQYFPEGSFEKVYVLFPDPWPKPRHAFRRLLTVEFLRILAGQLQDGGELILATDVQEYAEWVDQGVDQISALRRIEGKETGGGALPATPQTFFGRKWRSQDKRILYRSYCKKQEITSSFPWSFPESPGILGGGSF